MGDNWQGGGRGQKYQKMGDLIYGRPHKYIWHDRYTRLKFVLMQKKFHEYIVVWEYKI